MGIKKMFSRKEPTEQELREDLSRSGIAVKGNNTRAEKFGAFKAYAGERAAARPGLAPVNPYANVGMTQGNPYSDQGQADQNGNQANPYGNQASSGNQGNPYGNQNNGGSPYSSQNRGNNGNPYGNAQNGNAYGRPTSYGSNQNSASPYDNPRSNASVVSNRSSKPSPYSSATSRKRDDESVLDLNRMPTNQEFTSTQPARRPPKTVETDLNIAEEEDDLNLDVGEDLPEEEQVNSEDEEIEAIKQDIRFVKQESVASTRNTLRMAQEADALAINTMGMLGSQSERLYNAEQNLLLADTQTQIADSKVKELHRLNRSIFIPATGNPFNKKSRLRQQEEKIKNSKAQEKYMRETNRQAMYASEQRIKQGITTNATDNDIANKYRGERDLAAAQRYQFENDSEDDEMEKELAANLDHIGSYAKKLKNNAKTIGQEVDSQNGRLRKIEEDADRLDINVHMNNTRLQNIR